MSSQIQTGFPQGVLQQLDYISSYTQDRIISMPDTLTTVELIPLIGFLLEYPVAYIPESREQRDFLSGVPLDIYKCFITNSNSNDPQGVTPLLKFSCPVDITPSLSPSVLMNNLKDRVTARLSPLDRGCTVLVNHEVREFDRVAL